MQCLILTGCRFLRRCTKINLRIVFSTCTRGVMDSEVIWLTINRDFIKFPTGCLDPKLIHALNLVFPVYNVIMR